jgi:biopolymer transport protein ExbD
MIDVMMILTIFLSVMAFMPQVRTSIEAKLPQASSATDTPPSTTIELTRDGISLDDKVVSPY